MRGERQRDTRSQRALTCRRCAHGAGPPGHSRSLQSRRPLSFHQIPPRPCDICETSGLHRSWGSARGTGRPSSRKRTLNSPADKTLRRYLLTSHRYRSSQVYEHCICTNDFMLFAGSWMQHVFWNIQALTTNLLLTFSRICFSLSAMDSPFLFFIRFFSSFLQAYIFPVARTWHAHTWRHDKREVKPRWRQREEFTRDRIFPVTHKSTASPVKHTAHYVLSYLVQI